ncbi:hypothetical protein ACO0LO_17915 [Undibacterium sp. TJN25]|uniref:hypothetical protein n=1 Tax=Undibacterium sp. TJN25 TaxID=3413056 RepID=UPI003BF41DA5
MPRVIKNALKTPAVLYIGIANAQPGKHLLLGEAQSHPQEGAKHRNRQPTQRRQALKRKRKKKKKKKKKRKEGGLSGHGSTKQKCPGKIPGEVLRY